MASIVDLLMQPYVPATWRTLADNTLQGLLKSRYHDGAKKTSKVRASDLGDSGVSFAAVIHSNNPDSGPYGGTSLVVFPIRDKPAMVGLVVGTQGLSPEEEILGRPGHARKAQALVRWLNSKHPGHMLGWTKSDPTRIDQDVPKTVVKQFEDYRSVFERYGRYLYAFYVPSEEYRDIAEDAAIGFFDILVSDRGHGILAAHSNNANRIRDGWRSVLLPELTIGRVRQLLEERRFVIIEGPPGTGKTRMALKLKEEVYAGHGMSIQFHANTTYESFVGGLGPTQTDVGLGLSFAPVSGALMQAAARAVECAPEPFLLHIDEINRADLAKVLGEAIYLLEPNLEAQRFITLPYHFRECGSTLSVPKNLHIVGTMNSSDRSIAVVDIAIRRRFAFAKMWPSWNVVRECGGPLMRRAYERLSDIFIEYANEEAFDLLPGHSYFLETDDKRAARRLMTEVAPLLGEYLAQGYVGGFASEITAYLQWLEAEAKSAELQA